MRERVRARVLLACANHAGAGFGGTSQERNNMEAVLCVMHSERFWVEVVLADSVSAWERGECAGAWSLGATGAQCAGTILWCSGHVYVVRGNAPTGGKLALREPLPPWMHDDVARGKKGVRTEKRKASLAAANAARLAKQAESKGKRAAEGGCAEAGDDPVGRAVSVVSTDAGIAEGGGQIADVPGGGAASSTGDVPDDADELRRLQQSVFSCEGGDGAMDLFDFGCGDDEEHSFG